MFAQKALGRGCSQCWLVVAMILPLGGCANTNPSNIPAPANEGRTLVSSSDTGSLLRMARATRQAGDLMSSIQIYKTVLATKSATPEISVEYGDVLLESGSPDDAIDIYGQIDGKSPARLSALLGLTRAYISLGEADNALDMADKAQLLAPQDARVLVDRGVALDALKRHAEAQQSYRAVLVAAPRHISARNDLALSLALTGQFDEALAIIAPLGRSVSATPRVRENIALIYGLMGNASQAESVSRVDLSETDTQANLAFLAAVRGTKP